MKLKDFLLSAFISLKPSIMNYLEKRATKILLAKLIRSPWMLDIRVWLIGFAVDYLSEHLRKPAIDYFFRKVGYAYEVADGKHLLTKIANSSDVGEWEANADEV